MTDPSILFIDARNLLHLLRRHYIFDAMQTIRKSKTLQDVLKPYKIYSAKELARVCGMSRQQADELWAEKCGIGKRVAKRIAEATGCSAATLLLYK